MKLKGLGRGLDALLTGSSINQALAESCKTLKLHSFNQENISPALIWISHR